MTIDDRIAEAEFQLRAAQLAFTGLPRGIDRYADPMGQALSVDYARAWGMLQALRKLKETSEKPPAG